MLQKLQINKKSLKVSSDYTFKATIVINNSLKHIRGAFDVGFDGTIATVVVSPMWISGIDSPNLVDIDDLCKCIQELDDGTWFMDKMNERSEQFNDVSALIKSFRSSQAW